MTSVYKLSRFCLLCALAFAVMVALSRPATADSYTDQYGDIYTLTMQPDTGGDAGNTWDLTLEVNTTGNTIGSGYFMGWNLGNADSGGWGNNFVSMALDPSDFGLSTGPISPGGSGGCQNNVTASGCLNINPGLAMGGDWTWTVDVTLTDGASFSAAHIQALWSPDQTNPTANGAHNLVSQDVDATTVPEPGSLMLFGTGLIGLAGFLRHKLMS